MGKLIHRRQTTDIVFLLMALLFTCRAASGQTAQVDTESNLSKDSRTNASTSLKQLQGKWKSVKSTYKEAKHLEGSAIRFRNDKVSEIFTAGSKEAEDEAFDFALDESKSPKWIDFGERKGIFQIKGDLLIVCVGDEDHRPTEFNLTTAAVEAPVVSSGAYPRLPARDPGVGFWVPYDLKWEDGGSKLLVFQKVR